MAKELQEILNTDEKIIWQGKPHPLLYYSSLVSGVIIMFVVVGIIFHFVGASLVASGKATEAGSLPYITLGFPIGFALILLMYRFFAYKYILYLLTDKRLIMQSGIIGRDFQFVDYDKIENSSVDVDLFDKIMRKNTGTISIYANRIEPVTRTYQDASGVTRSSTTMQNIPYVFLHIVDPYAVFNIFKKVSFDIKADVNFPNALRPAQDAGYQTDYTPKS